MKTNKKLNEKYEKSQVKIKNETILYKQCQKNEELVSKFISDLHIFTPNPINSQFLDNFVYRNLTSS